MEKPNIVFIVLDTLREDYVEYFKNNLVNKYGFIFYKNSISCSPWTTPAHASIFTGNYPLIHGVHESRNRKITDVKLESTSILNVYLKSKGYITYLLSANPLISPHFGFTGFKYLYLHDYSLPLPLLNNHDLDELREIKLELSSGGKKELLKALLKERKYKLLFKDAANHFLIKLYHPIYMRMNNWPKDKGVRKILPELKKFLEKRYEKRFIFLNFMEMHEPYSRKLIFKKYFFENILFNKEIDERVISIFKMKYRDQAKYLSSKIIELLNLLMEYNEFDRSLIIITSDHGQLLGEYKRIGHGIFLYDELLKIPLLIKYPENISIRLSENEFKYISLVNFKKFIVALVNGRINSDDILYSDIVFSESYGVHIPYGRSVSDKINDLEKYRIAVYYDNLKMIFNVSDWCIESIYPEDYKRSDIVFLKKKVIDFLKSAIRRKLIKKLKYRRLGHNIV